MIKEIVQFVDVLPPEAFTRNLTLDEGLYLFLDIQKQGDKYRLINVDDNGYVLQEDKLVVDKNTELSPIYNEFLFRFENSKMINAMKSFNSSAKIFIAIGTPLGFSVSKKAIEENIAEQDKKSRKNINEALEFYFKRSMDYLDSSNGQFLQWSEGLKYFSFEGLPNMQETYNLNESTQKFPLNKILYYLIQQPEYSKLGKNSKVTVFIKDPSLEDYKPIYQKYLSEKVFNKDDYNKSINGVTHGISDSLSGFNDNKAFLQHRTAPLEYNFRVNEETAIKLYHFFQLQKNRGLPNPTPIFVDKDELLLNESMVALYNDNKSLGYSEIIKSLLEKKQSDLQNFYLIFFQNDLKGSKINDLDFVPVFQYSFPYTIANIFNLKDFNKNIIPNYSLVNVFDFENLLHKNAFFITKKNTGFRYGFLKGHYFDKKPVPPKGYELNSTVRQNLLKFGLSIYDYIYKSKKQSLTGSIFDEIMVQSILFDLNHDDKFVNDHLIKEKLNIWFSLYNYFQNSNQSKRENMVNKTVELIEKLKQVAHNEQQHIGNDDEFVFGAGQLIWKILSQSKSANRSHALLEPFLQKVDPTLFKQAIAKAFDTYKHEFVFYPIKYEFDKIMSEVMGYEPNERNMKNQLSLILAGYFAETIFKAEQSK
jgi:CRISPR-associated protein Csh1